MTRFTTAAGVAIMALWFTASGAAAPVDEQTPFKAVGTVGEEAVPAGGTVEATITVHILADHYLYKDATSVEIDDAAGLTVTPPTLPEAKHKFDKWENSEVEIYDHTFTIPLRIDVPADAAAGRHDVAVAVRYRGCNPKMCFFPTTDDLVFSVNVGGTAPVDGGAAATDGAGGGTTDGAGDVGARAGEGSAADGSDVASGGGEGDLQRRLAGALESAAQRNFLLVLLLAFIGGLLSSLTPCVFPMIPITIAVIGARGADSKARAFSLSLVYVLGIATLYSILGVVAAATGGVLGGLFSNPWVVSGLIVLFVALAAGMFGFYNFALPASLNTRLSQAGGQGFLGVYVIGLAAGVVASPCTGPVVGSALILISSGAFSIVQGFLVMFVYSLGLGVLFLAIGTFSASVPQAGPWMSHVKNSFGFMMILAAIYFASTLPFVPAPAATVVAAIALVCWGVVLGLFTPMEPEAGWSAWLLRSFAVLVVMVGFLLLARVVGLGGSPHPQPSAADAIAWEVDVETAYARAEAEGLPILLDFTAENCAQCRELEHKTFPDPGVVAASRALVPLTVDCTRIDEVEQGLIDKHGVPGMPRLVFLYPDGEEIPDLAIQGYVPPATLIAAMQSAASAVESR